MVPDPYLAILEHHLRGVDRASLRLIDAGYANAVIVVDGRLVVRIARHDWGAGALRGEGRVLALVGPRLSVAVPRWEVWSDGVVAYPIVPGVPLEAADFHRRSDGDRRRLGGQIARFLGELHAITPEDVIAAGIGAADARTSDDGWEPLMAEARRVLYPRWEAAARDRAERLFAAVCGGRLDPGGDSALIHADLAACHLLWDGSAPRLTGVLDFACAGRGDPALDVAALLEIYGEAIVGPLAAGLPGLRERLGRARAYAALGLIQRQLDDLAGPA